MDSNGRTYQTGLQPPILGSSSKDNYQSIRPPPRQLDFASNRPPSIPRQESSKPTTPSHIQPPQLPDWARSTASRPISHHHATTVNGDSHNTSQISLPVLPRSPVKQDTPSTASRVQQSPSQFTVQLKASPSKQTSLYRKVDDAAKTPAAAPKQGRKRPQPGAMDVVNMFAAMTGEGTTAGFPSTPGSVNRRGRPKGWKPGMSYAAIRGNPPPGSSTSNGLPRGKKPTTVHDVMRRQYLRSRPDFAPFICEWVEAETGTQCPAELHNLDTLRRHIFLVHVVDNEEDEKGDGEEDPANFADKPRQEKHNQNQQVCRWGRCATQDPPTAFLSDDALDDHIEAHLQAMAWHVGAGYQNKGLAAIKQDTRQDYLNDKTGFQVTPSIQEQQLETDHQRKERKRRLRALEMQRDENAPDEEDFMKQTLGTEEAVEEQE